MPREADRPIELGAGSPTVGVVGGGQLGRMLGEAAAPLGVDVIVCDPTPDPPAAPVVSETVAGPFDDPETVRAVAERADVLTVEIELADPDVLETVAGATGIPVHPAPETLRMTRDKLEEKRRLDDAGIPVTPFRAVETPADVEAAIDRFGLPVMLKARFGGYDGRGNVPIESPEAVPAALEAVAGPAIVEDVVAFDRELSVMGAIGRDEHDTFVPVENRHEREILRETVAPARTDDRLLERATAVATAVLDELDGRGVFGIELFETDGAILVNEVAPRPHNSGHYTIEGAVTSQFAQHLRAVLGWPLGSTALRCPTVMANVLGDGETTRAARLSGIERVLERPGASLHWYGKRDVRPLRKMGHLTCVPTTGEGRDELLERARDLVAGVAFEGA